jgi:hypothetical protein
MKFFSKIGYMADESDDYVYEKSRQDGLKAAMLCLRKFYPNTGRGDNLLINCH